MTSTRETERLDASGAIEGFSDGRAPVDDQRIERLVRDREPTNVIGVANSFTVDVAVELAVAIPVAVGLVIDAAEEQWLVANGELVESMQRGAHDDVAFDEIPSTAHVGDGSAVAQRACTLAHLIERPKGEIEELLFLSNLTLVRH